MRLTKTDIENYVKENEDCFNSEDFNENFLQALDMLEEDLQTIKYEFNKSIKDEDNIWDKIIAKYPQYSLIHTEYQGTDILEFYYKDFEHCIIFDSRVDTFLTQVNKLPKVFKHLMSQTNNTQYIM